jgi:hypothetical protein
MIKCGRFADLLAAGWRRDLAVPNLLVHPGGQFFRTRGRQASILPFLAPASVGGGADHTLVLHGKVPKPPDQVLLWGAFG